MDTTPDNRLETMQQACELIATGSLVADAAKTLGTTAKTLRQWAATDPDLGALYTRARLISAGALEDEALSVARSSTAETYSADRVLIDTLKWAAAKRHPKEYGDKVQHDSTVTIRNAVIMMPPETVPEITATATLSQLQAPQEDSAPEPVINAS